MHAKPYSRYKPSGVDWLGDLPEGWKVKRLKYYASINDETLPETTPEDFEIKYVDIGSVDAVDGITTVEDIAFEDAPSRARRIVRDGDTIVSTVRTYLRAIAPIRRPPENLIVSTGFAVVRPRKLDSKYLSYTLRESRFVETVVARSVGVSYPGVNASDVATIPITLPPEGEQHAIGNFLDREMVKIDVLVAKKRMLVERLKEKRTALISRTVTRGLPLDAAVAAGIEPKPKLKSSGIECLGSVPAHWEIKPFRYLISRLDQGWSPVAANWPADDGEWGVLKLSAARDGNFVPSENKALDADFDGSAAVTPCAGNLLISRSNTPDRVGDVCLVSHDYPKFLIPDLLYRVELKSKIVEPAFICLFLLSKSARAQIESDARGSSGSMVKLGQDHVRDWKIPCPPKPEQRAIADYVGRKTQQFDRMVEKVEEAIERLHQYRTALITAAVTGKIDVRGESADNRRELASAS